MLLLSMFLAVAVPISYLFVIHWLDLYGTDRPRIVLTCFGWGVFSFLLAFAILRPSVLFLGLSVQLVSTVFAPFLEEVFKAGILVHLMRRAKLNYFVDGAIYGFASGIGFSAIENLRYIQRNPDNVFGVTVLRDFSCSLGHGTMTAMTGIALGGFVMSARSDRGIRPLVAGLLCAMTLHYAWNNFAYFSPLSRFATEWVLVGVALTGLAVVAAAILWGLRRERLQLRRSLGMDLGVSEEEAGLVQHMDDLDRLLKPIEKRFGKVKRRHVADFLHLEAQLGLTQEAERGTADPKLRAVLAAEIGRSERELDAARRKVGIYVMLYVRSIFPPTSWSLWARLGQSLVKARTPRTDLWRTLDARLPAPGAAAGSLYARIEAELAARAKARPPAAHRVKELPDAMQKCMHWVMQEVHVTARHAAASLGHHEAHAMEMLNELVARGFLHRITRDGHESYRARVVAADGQAAGAHHLWHSLAHRLGHHHKGSEG